MWGNLQTPLCILLISFSFVQIQGQNTSPSDRQLVPLCNKRLLYTIKGECEKLRRGSLDIETSYNFSSPQKRMESFSEVENEDPEYEGEMGDEPQADESGGSRSMGIVRDCCHKPCTRTMMQLYCKRFFKRRVVQPDSIVINYPQEREERKPEPPTCKPCVCKSEGSRANKVPRAVLVGVVLTEPKNIVPVFGQPTNFPGRSSQIIPTPYPAAITDAPFFSNRNPFGKHGNFYGKK